MRTLKGLLIAFAIIPAPAVAASREINPYLAQVPFSYDVISKVEKWEGEGSRGHSAKIKVHGRVFEIVSICDHSSGRKWFPALLVTVWFGDEYSEFDLSGPGDQNRELRMPLIKSEIIPHDFYRKTCQSRGG